MNLNKAMVIGNLTRDPETRTTPSGQTVTSFSVATSRSWVNAEGQKQEKTEFHNIVSWGKLAEICANYLSKGRKVYVEGRLQTRDWQGQDGIKRYRTEIVADNMIMLDRAPEPKEASAAVSASSESPAEEVPTEEVEVEKVPF